MELVFALDYIPRRMKELGFDEYAVRYRHVRVIKNEKITIDADNTLLLSITPNAALTIKSKAGIFKIGSDAINELQYEHRGKVTVKNDGLQTIYALFIQAIPLHKNNRKKNSNGRDSAPI